MIGLSFRETMSGSVRLASEPGVDRPMSFTIRASIPSLWRLASAPLFDIEGAVVAEGLADHKPLRGSLHVDLLRGKVLVYMFDFEANDGRALTFSGRKELGSGDLVHAMTVLPGAVRDAAGAEVARALLRFDLRSDLLRFLSSYRLVRS